MVVVPDPDGAGPVELLKKEQTADFVGKGEGGKGEAEVSPLKHACV